MTTVVEMAASEDEEINVAPGQPRLLGGASTAFGVVFFNTDVWGAARTPPGDAAPTASGAVRLPRLLLLPGLTPFRSVFTAQRARNAAYQWWRRDEEGTGTSSRLTALVAAATMLLISVIVAGVALLVGVPLASPGREMVQAALIVAIAVMVIRGLSRSIRREGSAALHAAEHQLAACYAETGRVSAVEAKAYPSEHPLCGSGLIIWIFVVFGAFHIALATVDAGVFSALLLRVVAIPLSVFVAYIVHKLSSVHFARFLTGPNLAVQRWLLAPPSDADRQVAAAALSAWHARAASATGAASDR